jgi:hypothetical protein
MLAERSRILLLTMSDRSSAGFLTYVDRAAQGATHCIVHEALQGHTAPAQHRLPQWVSGRAPSLLLAPVFAVLGFSLDMNEDAEIAAESTNFTPSAGP